MSNPRKHHYIPKFYLKGFSEDEKRIYQIEKTLVAKAYELSVNDAAAVRDYHKLDDGVADVSALEIEFSKIEGEHAKALEILFTEGRVPEHIRAKIIEFISLMRFRVPSVKEFLRKSRADFVECAFKIMERNGEFPPRPKGLEGVPIIAEIANFALLSDIMQMAFSPKHLDCLNSMKMTILRAHEEASFITSDQPVVFYNAKATKLGKKCYTNLTDRNSKLILPISNLIAIQLGWDPAAPETAILSTDEIAEYNRMVVVMAESYIFSSNVCEKTKALVINNSKYRAGFESKTLSDDKKHLFLRITRPVMPSEQYIS